MLNDVLILREMECPALYLRRDVSTKRWLYRMRTENEQQIAMIGEHMNRRFCVEQIIKASEDLQIALCFFLDGTPSQLFKLEGRTRNAKGE